MQKKHNIYNMYAYMYAYMYPDLCCLSRYHSLTTSLPLPYHHDGLTYNSRWFDIQKKRTLALFLWTSDWFQSTCLSVFANKTAAYCDILFDSRAAFVGDFACACGLCPQFALNMHFRFARTCTIDVHLLYYQ